MSDLRKAAQQALEALEDACGNRCNAENNPCYQRIVAEVLRAALAQPEQEPVAYRFQSPATEAWLLGLEPPVGSRWEIEPLYATPPQRQPLTEDVLKAEFAKLYKSDAAILHLAENNRDYALESIGARHHWTAFKSGARAIEKAHGIGND